ncbi:MAG: NFACT family protein, partial [Deltaproteobacteria bacterium]|nr:NFACT family protein [Deltaproteobacteria bacterium]
MQPEISLSSPIELPMSPALAGARIQGVWQDGDRALVLETHSGAAGVAWWLFSLDAAHTRLERLAARPSRPAGKKSGGQPAFCQWLRSKLLGARVASLRLPHPQMVKLELTKGPAGEQDRYFLLLELNRRVSNLLLLDSAENLLIALRHPAHAGRKMGPGKPYAPPAKIYPYPEGVPLEMRYPAPDTEEEQARREIWRNLESGEPSRASPEGGKGNADVDREQREAQKAARRELKKIRRRKANLEQDLEGVSQAGEWLRLGELLQINSHLIRPGMSSLTVPDVFQPGQPETVIELDPGATPGENMERHFRRARKLTASEPHVRERLVRAEEEERAWEGLLGLLGGEEGPADAGVPGWDAIRQEARTRYPAEARRLGLFGGVARGVAGGVTGGVAAGRSVAARTGTSGGMAEEPPGVIIRTSSDGHTLLAGRTAEANDR